MDKIEKLLEFLKASPTDAFLQHALALEYIKAGDDAAAKKLFIDILERDPAYVGSYYHLGKLLERTGDPVEATTWYEKGMQSAKNAGDRHAYGELQGALESMD